MTSTERTTRAIRSAQRRVVLFRRRLAAAVLDRQRLNAVVGWWMAEWYRLPAEQQAVEFGRLQAIVEEMNRRAET